MAIQVRKRGRPSKAELAERRRRETYRRLLTIGGLVGGGATLALAAIKGYPYVQRAARKLSGLPLITPPKYWWKTLPKPPLSAREEVTKPVATREGEVRDVKVLYESQPPPPYVIPPKVYRREGPQAAVEYAKRLDETIQRFKMTPPAHPLSPGHLLKFKPPHQRDIEWVRSLQRAAAAFAVLASRRPPTAGKSVTPGELKTIEPLWESRRKFLERQWLAQGRTADEISKLTEVARKQWEAQVPTILRKVGAYIGRKARVLDALRKRFVRETRSSAGELVKRAEAGLVAISPVRELTEYYKEQPATLREMIENRLILRGRRPETIALTNRQLAQEARRAAQKEVREEIARREREDEVSQLLNERLVGLPPARAKQEAIQIRRDAREVLAAERQIGLATSLEERRQASARVRELQAQFEQKYGVRSPEEVRRQINRLLDRWQRLAYQKRQPGQLEFPFVRFVEKTSPAPPPSVKEKPARISRYSWRQLAFPFLYTKGGKGGR